MPLISALCIVIAVVVPVRAGPDEQPGDRFEIRVDDLPAPGVEKSGVNPPNVIPREPGDTLRVPEGFKVNIFAEGLSFPRWLTIAPNGDVFLTQASSPFRDVDKPNRVIVLRDEDQDGIADKQATFAEGFDRPLGLVFHGDDLLVADQDGVWRLPYEDGALESDSRERITPPGALGEKKGHYHRIIALHPDGEHMMVTVGSISNVEEDPLPHATIQKFRLDGSGQETYASGLRNPIGTAFYPGTEELYTVVNERDMYGDSLVPDYFTRVEEGDFFGWPYAYMGANPDPDFGDKRPDLVAKTKVPDVLFDAHSAPVGLLFYDGEQFPAEYRGDAFVALHGSFNKAKATGYKVVRIPFEDGKPQPWYENFATGFWKEGETPPVLMGRPAGLAVLPDGSLLIGDDWNDTIWRVSYPGAQR